MNLKFLRPWWKRHDTDEAIERARLADVDAGKQLRRSRETAAWVDKTLRVNHLTEMFLRDLEGRRS